MTALLRPVIGRDDDGTALSSLKSLSASRGCVLVVSDFREMQLERVSVSTIAIVGPVEQAKFGAAIGLAGRFA
ncbi:hypothetical protein J3459_003803 [Metarhizium acridum]|nr:hypothetical protein J3459_003803 [Metarhizium acridum]